METVAVWAIGLFVLPLAVFLFLDRPRDDGVEDMFWRQPGFRWPWQRR